MSTSLKLAALAAASLLGSATAVQAAILVQDTFTYSDGALTTVSGGVWSAHSGAGVVPVQVSGNDVSLVQGSGSREDVNISLGTTQAAGQTFYGGFDLTVAGVTPVTAVYFAHFRDLGTDFNGRAFVATSAVGGDFVFGISEVSGTTPDSTSATGYSFGTTYRVVTSYNFDTGLGQLFVALDDGATTPVLVATSTTADIGQDMQTFGLRQGGGNTSQVIDNLVVATSFAEAAAVPEPASLGLLGLAGLGLMRRRRA